MAKSVGRSFPTWKTVGVDKSLHIFVPQVFVNRW